MTRSAARAAVLGLGLLAAIGVQAPALRAQTQTTTLSVTGGSTTTFAQPGFADYIAGYIDGPTISFNVSLANGPSGKSHTVTVEICAATATLGGAKAISKLMWQPSDASKPWQSMTSSCAGAVDPARTIVAATMNRGDSFSSGVKLRMILDWTDTAPSYGTTIAMTVNVSTP
ncbi:MAG TPA: hypothetical protein VGQ44_12080 [Gemmatimonadaceae bacterium]|nr:hypothetical protein [Gemmatimonadaceae bacterium]